MINRALFISLAVLSASLILTGMIHDAMRTRIITVD